MRNKKNQRLIIISIVVICMNTISLCMNQEKTNFELSAKISQPILELEKEDSIKTQINEESFPMEYHFSIHNFKEEKINEVLCEYVIELEDSEENFPAHYTLVDCDKNQEIPLTDGKSEPILLAISEKESRAFKLILTWQELDVELAENLQIKLKINVEQCEEEKV